MRHSFLAIVSAIALVTAAACVHRTPAEDHRQSAARLDSIRIAADDARAKKQVNLGTQAVDITDADRNRFSRVEQMIQAKFSGIVVSSNGGGYSMRIRGADSFMGSPEPLVILDGSQITPADLAAVNAKDVVRIEVLKDAAASLYGVRGGNGVIIVTTRRIP